MLPIKVRPLKGFLLGNALWAFNQMDVSTRDNRQMHREQVLFAPRYQCPGFPRNRTAPVVTPR